MDYQRIVKELRQFRDERHWQKFHNLKDLAISVNLEASEVLEIFQWVPENHQLTPEERNHLVEELSDTMIYLIYMFDKLGIDPGKSIEKKINFNRSRHWPKIDNGGQSNP